MMQDDIVIPAVSATFEYPTNVEYLSDQGGAAPAAVDVGDISSSAEVGVGVLQNLELMGLIQMFIVYAFLIVGFLSAVFIFVGGVSFILSGGDDEKIKRAVNTIRYSIIGLIITMLSFFAVVIIGRMFGLNLIGYISYERIISSIERLVKTTDKPSGNFDIQR